VQPVNRLSGKSAPSVTGCPEFDYAPGQPNLYLMMRYKQDLVAQHGVEGGFERFRQKFGLPATARLREAVIESDRAFSEQGAAFFVETAAAGEPFVNQPPRIVGKGNHRPIAGVTRSQYVACFEDARVRGRSALIDVSGHVLYDVQGDEGARLDDEREWDPSVFCTDGRRSWCIEGADSAPPIDVDEAFTLLGAHTDFFGHWMCEYLPKFVAAKLSGYLPDVPLLIDADMPGTHRQSLEFLYGPVPVIEVPAFQAVRVKKLWCAPALSYLPLHEIRNERFSWDAISASGARFEPIVRELQARFDARTDHLPPSGSRVFLARKAFRHRRLANGEAIEQIARESGFDVVYPEDLSFTTQAAVVRRARVVIAPEGSAVFLTMFSRPGTRLCILSHQLTDLLADYNALLAPHQIDVMALTGPITRAKHSSPNDSDYEIDEGLLRATLSVAGASAEGRTMSPE
jgi:hypothetical protein